MPLPLVPLVIGGYVVGSATLLAFPQLLHRRLGQAKRLRHGSHRGGSAEATENTLPAFRNAVRAGSQLLELDVHLTADEHVVVVHDPELSRLCGVAATVAGTRYADLPRYLPPEELVLPPPFHAPKVTLAETATPEMLAAERDSPPGDLRRMPLLSEVFEEFPDTFVNIDLKGRDPNGVLLRKVHELIVSHKRQANTCWGSFDDAKTRACYEADPSIPLLFSAKRSVVLLALFYSGLLPFVSLKESYLEIPLLTAADQRRVQGYGYLPSGSGLGNSLKRGLAQTAGWLLRSKILFSHLEKRGISTLVWTYNEEKEFEEAFGAGVTGVMTDYPSRLRKFLDEKDAADAAADAPRSRM